MAKILSMNLFYKGKKLDKVIYRRDFNSTFYIGSDKNLFWQILDAKFPEKHLFIQKKGAKYEMNLLKQMEVSVTKGTQEMDMAELKKQNYVKGNSLILDESMSGSVTFGNVWRIEYAFAHPFVPRHTPQELRDISTFGRYPDMSPNQRFTFIFLVVALIMTFFAVRIMEKRFAHYTEINVATNINELAARRKALRVNRPVQPVKLFETGAAVEEETPEEPQEEEKKEEQTDLASQFDKTFGFSVNSDSPSTTKKNVEFISETTTMRIVAGKAGSGSLSKTRGSGKAGKNAGTSLEDAFGSGTGTITDLSTSSLGSLSDLSSGVDLSKSKMNLTDVTDLAGNMGDIEVVKIRSEKEFAEAKTRFGKTEKLSETNEQLGTSIGGANAQAQGDAKIIDAYIRNYDSRLTKIFTRERFKANIYGTIKFILLINPNGSIEAVQIQPVAGSKFNASILEKFRTEILTWVIKVSRPVEYEFSRVFTAE